MTSNLLKTKEVMDNLKKLDNGWGGLPHTKKPAQKAVRAMKKVLTNIEEGRMPWPDVKAVAAGGLILTWVSLTRDIMITIDTDGSIQFVTSLKRIDPNDSEILERVDSEGTITDMKVVDHMMAWYCIDSAHSA